MIELLLLLLPVAAASGWWIGRRETVNNDQQSSPNQLSSEYFAGLNFLLNEQPDKAVDVFINLLSVDSDTVETHLALGSLFRRRGEVDRAIRIHQNLIARPNLSKQQRFDSLYELAQDYMRAGVLDRAEALFLELIESVNNRAHSLRALVDIYHQQRDWEQAIAMSQRLEFCTGENQRPVIAHYYCELADEAKAHSGIDKINRFVKKAFQANAMSVRAHLLQAELACAAGRFKMAISNYKRIIDWQPVYVGEVIKPLSICYEQLGREQAFIDYLQELLDKHQQIDGLSVGLATILSDYQRRQTALQLLTSQLTAQPNLAGLALFVELQLQQATNPDGSSVVLPFIHQCLQQLQAQQSAYQCTHCGFPSKVHYWHCPSCKHWDTIKPAYAIQLN